jgi:heat shock protein HslJ
VKLLLSLAPALALVFAVTSVIAVLAQDEAIAVNSAQRDWRLIALSLDGAMAPVTDVVAAHPSASPGPSTAPTRSPTANTLVLGVPTLSLEDDRRAGGWTGCNAWTASYTLDGDAVTLGPVAVTRGACPEPAGSLEAAFLDDLERVAAWSTDADEADPDLELLSLADAAGDQLLVFEPQPASPLLGAWRVTAYRDAAGAVVPTIPGEMPTATFDTDGLVTGVTGCNQYSAEYRVDGQALIVGTPFVTSADCEEPLTAQQQAFLAALEASAHASMLSATTLLLTDAVGSATLILEAEAPAPSPHRRSSGGDA